MIKSGRQYQVTKDQRDLLRAALKAVRGMPAPSAIARAQMASLKTDIGRLDQELKEFDTLRVQTLDPAPLDSLAMIGGFMVKYRVSNKITQKQLAVAVGKKEQTIQRYERKNYATASLKTLGEIGTAIKSLAEAGRPGQRRR